MKYLFIVCVLLVAETCHNISKTSVAGLSSYELKLRLVDSLGDLDNSDSTMLPPERPETELNSAQQFFDPNSNNSDEIKVIAAHAGIANTANINDAGKLMIYKQHKVLTVILLDTVPEKYCFRLNVKTSTGKKWHYEGKITPVGKISIKTKKPIKQV